MLLVMRKNPLQAGDKYWHEHHFICCDCGVRIRGDTKVRKIHSIFFFKESKNKLVKCQSRNVSKSSPSYWYAQVDNNIQVWQKEGRLYCDADYKKKFVPRCAHCSGFILGVKTNLSLSLYLFIYFNIYIILIFIFIFILYLYLCLYLYSYLKR